MTDRLDRIREAVDLYLKRPVADLGTESAQPQDVLFLPGLPVQPWYDAATFSWATTLQAAAPTIRAELDAVRERGLGFQPYTQPGGPVESSGRWDAFYFSFYGRTFERNARLCPVTTAAIAAIPRRTGLIFFSRLSPGTHIAAHIGPTNARLTCHLGLHIPDGVTIRVDDQIRAWLPDDTIAFDDSFEHEVWHRGQADRYVLLFQVWHPDLTDSEVAYLDYVQRHALAPRLKPYREAIEKSLVAAHAR